MAFLNFSNKKETLKSEEPEINTDTSTNDFNIYDMRKKAWVSSIVFFMKNYIAINEQLVTLCLDEKDCGCICAFKSNDIREYGEETFIVIKADAQEVIIVTDGIKIPQERFVEGIVGVSLLDNIILYNNGLRFSHTFSSISDDFEFDVEKFAELVDVHFTYYKNVTRKFINCIENNIDFTTIGA